LSEIERQFLEGNPLELCFESRVSVVDGQSYENKSELKVLRRTEAKSHLRYISRKER